jgi:hypothetical protein
MIDRLGRTTHDKSIGRLKPVSGTSPFSPLDTLLFRRFLATVATLTPVSPSLSLRVAALLNLPLPLAAVLFFVGVRACPLRLALAPPCRPLNSAWSALAYDSSSATFATAGFFALCSAWSGSVSDNERLIRGFLSSDEPEAASVPRKRISLKISAICTNERQGFNLGI